MSGEEFAAIEARARDAQSRGWFMQDANTTIIALCGAVRERDNTIARVRDIVESVHASDGLDPDGYQVAGLIRAALDPQETP